MTNPDHLPFIVRYKQRISTPYNIISTTTTIEILCIQSLYKKNKGSERDTEKGIQIRKLVKVRTRRKEYSETNI